MQPTTTHLRPKLLEKVDREQVVARIAALRREIAAMLATEIPRDLENQLHRARLHLKDAEACVRPHSKLRADAALYAADIVMTIAARHLADARAVLQSEAGTAHPG